MIGAWVTAFFERKGAEATYNAVGVFAAQERVIVDLKKNNVPIRNGDGECKRRGGKQRVN